MIVKNLIYKILCFCEENLLLLITYLISFITPAAPLLFWTGVMVIFDLITGALKDNKVNNNPITSRKMRPTVLKGMGYMIALLIALVAQTYISPDQPVLKAVFGLIFTIEAKSIDENITALTGFSFLKPLKKYINKVFNKE